MIPKLLPPRLPSRPKFEQCSGEPFDIRFRAYSDRVFRSEADSVQQEVFLFVHLVADMASISLS